MSSIESLKKRVEELLAHQEKLYKSVEHLTEENSSWHSGYDFGYIAGKISVLDSILDSLEELELEEKG